MPVAICRSLEDIRPIAAVHDAAAEIEIRYAVSLERLTPDEMPVEIEITCVAE